MAHIGSDQPIFLPPGIIFINLRVGMFFVVTPFLGGALWRVFQALYVSAARVGGFLLLFRSGSALAWLFAVTSRHSLGFFGVTSRLSVGFCVPSLHSVGFWPSRVYTRLAFCRHESTLFILLYILHFSFSPLSQTPFML